LSSAPSLSAHDTSPPCIDPLSLHDALPILGPLRGIAGVQVPIRAGNDPVGAEVAAIRIEPHEVPLDGTTDRSIDVPVLDDPRRRDAEGPQTVVDVVGLGPPPGRARKVLAGESVAAGLGHDVEVDAARLGFAEPA